jgi:hypothetical protein
MNRKEEPTGSSRGSVSKDNFQHRIVHESADYKLWA